MNSINNLSDRELLARFVAKRDEAAFRLLVARHGGLVWSVCRRMLACPQDREDVFQATFLKLLVHAERNSWHETLGGWLYRVAYHLTLKVSAARAREQALESVEEPCSEDNCFEEIQRQDLERALHEAIAQLPRRDRQAIVLCYFHKKSREEAAVEMGCSLSAVKNLLERARRKLYTRLGRRGLSCSLALIAWQQTVEAAPMMSAPLLERTVSIGMQKMDGGNLSFTPDIKNLSRGGFESMFPLSIATKCHDNARLLFRAHFGEHWLASGQRLHQFQCERSNDIAIAWKPDGPSSYANPALVSLTDKETKEQQQTSVKPAPPSKPANTEISKLIEQLGDSNNKVREDAFKKLIEIGEPAKALLKAAVKHPSAGVRGRAELALNEIENQRRERFERAMKSSWRKEKLQEICSFRLGNSSLPRLAMARPLVLFITRF